MAKNHFSKMFQKQGYSEAPIYEFTEPNGQYVPAFYFDNEAEELYHNDDDNTATAMVIIRYYSKKFRIFCDRRQDIRGLWKRACELIHEDDDDADNYYMYNQGNQINTCCSNVDDICKEDQWCKINVQWI